MQKRILSSKCDVSDQQLPNLKVKPNAAFDYFKTEEDLIIQQIEAKNHKC